MFDFLCENDILYDYKFGFRSKHSTQQALVTLVDRVTKSLDRENITISLFIDLRKAFRWEDAKRAYHKFINDEKIMRHIQRNPCTLRYTYSYTLIYTLHTEYTQNNRLLHKIIGTKE